MKNKIVKHFAVFVTTYSLVFILVTVWGKLTGYSPRDPIPLSWDELFSEYLNIILLIPAIIGLIAIYIKWDNDKHPE